MWQCEGLIRARDAADSHNQESCLEVLVVRPVVSLNINEPDTAADTEGIMGPQWQSIVVSRGTENACNDKRQPSIEAAAAFELRRRTVGL